MQEIQAPNSFSHINDFETMSIFLAGSIEMGTAEEWQKVIINEIKDYNIVVFNPRRDDWDSSWVQRASDPKFSEQVNWELDALKVASLIIFYFAPNTKSPISLLELGLHANKGNVLVCCPDDFWRKGNVEIVCLRNKIPLYNTLNDLISTLKGILNNVNVPTSKV